MPARIATAMRCSNMRSGWAARPGMHDGLYWPVTGTEEASPFGPFLAAAGVNPESRDPATPYYGYLLSDHDHARAQTPRAGPTTTSSTAT